MPRSIDSRTHQLAYVENLQPRRQSNFSAARISPMMPSWIRSSIGRSRPWCFLAIETTSRRFELISRSFARAIAALDPLREIDLLARA